MSRYVFKLPDLGEGTVEAEIVGWRVKAGDTVAEDDVLVEVMTEKAAVEVPSPVSGRVLSTTGAPGDMVPVGAELIVLETDAVGAASGAPAASAKPADAGAGVSSAAAPSAAGIAGGAVPPKSPAASAVAASHASSGARATPAGANGGAAPSATSTASGKIGRAHV